MDEKDRAFEKLDLVWLTDSIFIEKFPTNLLAFLVG